MLGLSLGRAPTLLGVPQKSKKERGAERRAMVAQLQREQKAKERRRSIIGIAVVAVIVLAIVVGVFFSVHNSNNSSASGVEKQVLPSTPTGATTTQTTPASVKNPTDVSGVLAWNTGDWPGPGTTGSTALSHDHVPGPVTYAVTPPVGGPHNPTWMNAGVYTQPIPAERAVHNLEHGAVWITYPPSLPPGDVDQLVSLFNRQSILGEDGGGSNRYIDLSPWANSRLPAPIVISSWGYQLRVQSPTDSRLQQFIDTFRSSQKYTPEYGEPVDGVPVQMGGSPAIGG